MHCENRFCIYQKDGKCIDDDIYIDTAGMCEDCIYINMDDDELQRRKDDLLRELDERDKDL